MNRTAMKPCRRDFLKASALLGLSATAPLLISACGGGDDDASPPATAGVRETRHLHFDLSLAPVQAPTLHALRSTHHRTPLREHDAASRAKHRALNPSLASVPDERMTHYLEDVDLPAGALQGVLLFGKHPDTKADVLVGSHIHVPSNARAAVTQRRAAQGESRKAADDGSIDPTISPFDAAVYLVFHHPEVMNLNPTLGAEILERIANLPCDPNDAACVPLIAPLAQAIAQRIASNGWPSTTPGSWMTLIPMTASDGSAVLDEQGDPVYRLDLDDEIAQKTGDVVKGILKNIFNDSMFEGSNWRAPPAAASQAVTSAIARQKPLAAALGEAFSVQARLPVGTSVSGIRMVGLEIADPTTRLVRLTVKNDYLRFLSVYVQYLDANEQPLPFEPGDLDSDRSLHLTEIGTNDQIMGIPFMGDDVESTDIEFVMPDAAAHANIIFGGLGLGGDAFTTEAVIGSSLTLALNIGVPTLLLAAGVYSDVKAGWKGLFTDKTLLKFLITELLKGLRDAGGDLAEGIYSSASTRDCKPFVTGLANVAIQALFAAAPTLVAYIGAVIAAGTIGQYLNPIGLAIKILSVLAEAAAIGVTIGEVFASPAITTNRVSLTMDSTVRIGKDPRDFQFPASATTYQVDAYYDGGATPRTQTGTVEPGRVEPIEVTFTGAPSGGNVVFQVSLYSNDGCLVGAAKSDKIANLPATASEVDIEIVERVAALTANTQHQHHLKLGYQSGARTWTQANAPQATRTSLCQGSSDAICNLNGLTVHTASGMAGYGFLAGGQKVGVCGGGAGDVLNTIQNQFLGQNPDRAAKFSGCGTAEPIGVIYDPLGNAVGGHHFFLQPAADGGFHLRGISLDTQTPFDMAQTKSWGRFHSALDSLAVVPSGYVVGVNRITHKMEVLLLPANAADPEFEAQAVAFAAIKAGEGSRPGLLDTPVAVATVQGAILVLEQGNARVQALDQSANPVELFKNKSTSLMPLTPETGVVYLDLAVESQGYMYVLSYIGDGLAPVSYRLDVYTPNGDFLTRTTGVAAARLAVDLFRNVYTLNYEPLSGSPRVEPTLSQWLPVTPNTCPSTLPASSAATQRRESVLACGPRSWLSRWIHA